MIDDECAGVEVWEVVADWFAADVAGWFAACDCGSEPFGVAAVAFHCWPHCFTSVVAFAAAVAVVAAFVDVAHGHVGLLDVVAGVVVNTSGAGAGAVARSTRAQVMQERHMGRFLLIEECGTDTSHGRVWSVVVGVCGFDD